MSENKKIVRISGSTQSSHDPFGNGLSIEGLSKEEFEDMTAMIVSGGNWVTTGDDRRLRVHPRREPLPSPTRDEDMLPFWSSAKQRELFKDKELIKFDDISGHLISPSIYISSLCGYHYSPENYKENAERLESFGFACLRSRRGRDSRFWEIWYLPGLVCAQGDFKEFLAESKKRSVKGKITESVEFLSKTILFGSLDVVIQRSCMVEDG